MTKDEMKQAGLRNGRNKVMREFQILLKNAELEAKEAEQKADPAKMDAAMRDGLIIAQWAVVINPLADKCDADMRFNAKVMNPKLDITTLFRFLCGKARELQIPGQMVAGVADQTVINWIDDFYDHEGMEMVEKEEAKKKANEERRAKQEAELAAKKTKKGKKAEKKTAVPSTSGAAAVYKAALQVKASDKAAATAEAKPEPKPVPSNMHLNADAGEKYEASGIFKTDASGQMSLFGMM